MLFRSAFTVGETVVGILRSVEEYGTFIEIAPNLAGLAESCPDLRPGQAVSVYIKNILPEKMKYRSSKRWLWLRAWLTMTSFIFIFSGRMFLM